MSCDIIRTENESADFAVKMTDDRFAPVFRKGETVLFQRRVDLRDGDVGLFEVDGVPVLRQFCEDSFGSVYLLDLQRTAPEDRMFPQGGEMPVCFGRAVMEKALPLPER